MKSQTYNTYEMVKQLMQVFSGAIKSSASRTDTTGQNSSLLQRKQILSVSESRGILGDHIMQPSSGQNSPLATVDSFLAGETVATIQK